VEINVLALGHFDLTDCDNGLGAVTKETEDLIVNLIDV